MSIEATTTTAAAPCKRGHVGLRDKEGRCVECRREDKRTAEQRRRDKAKAARSAPPSHLTPTLATLAAPPANEPAVIPGSFLTVAQEFLASQDNLAQNTAIKRNYLLAQLKALHQRPIAELTTPEIARALSDIQNVGDRRETAHRAAMLVASITAYAAVKGYAPTNALPAGTISKSKVLKPIQTSHHPAITDPRPGDNHDSAAKRFGRLMNAITSYELISNSRNHPSVLDALRLAPYIFVRPGELRHMEWSEINFDKAEWTIPLHKIKMRRMKGRTPQLVPLSTQALKILREQQQFTGAGKYVFPAKARTSQRHGEEQPLSENGFAKALEVILKLMREEPGAHVMHGFKSSARTLLTEQLHFDSELVELQLEHKRRGVVGVYDRSQRIAERRDLMQRWADYVDQLRVEAARAQAG